MKSMKILAGLCKSAILLGVWLLSGSMAMAQSGSISSSPNPCTIYHGQSLCSTTVSWSSQSTSSVQVWVSMNGAAETNFASSGGGSGYFQIASWIQGPPNNYVFRLYDYSSGSRGAQLASVTVSAVTVITCPT
jgi:hypothetical protein